jgi:predicted transcriptional regulator YdeE
MNKMDGFKIIGISVRTTNKDNQSAKDIAELWGRFYGENLLQKIPNQLSQNVYSIYTDYKSNFTDEYLTIIGLRVSSLDNIPAGLVGREFGPEDFEIFTARGEMPKAIIDTWISIWQQGEKLQRKYSYDLEVYDENSQKGGLSEVKIFIATAKPDH